VEPTTNSGPDRLVHWLVDGLEWQTTVFHVGQYCGRWEASTAGRSLASFHLVFDGACHLHLAGRPPIALGPRDGVFLLRDVPHHLSASADPLDRPGASAMAPLSAARAGGTSLACGFFQFRGAFTSQMLASFPDHVVLRAGDPALKPVAPLFELMLAEAPAGVDTPSPAIERLADLMFFYVMRHVAREAVAGGLWSLARHAALAPLLERLMAEPGRAWTAEEMARVVHMSRASFFRAFSDASGQAPAQFLLALRMQVAAQRLERGDSVARTAEHVGYQSYAAFARAFKRVIGEQPGAYQRGRRPDVASH